jgi:hypothetical protein
VPAPTPIELSSIVEVSHDIFDCIMRRADYPDDQRYRGAGDSKRLWTQTFYPFRLIGSATNDGSWDEFRDRPNFYFNQLPWGSYSQLQSDGIGGWTMSAFGGAWDVPSPGFGEWFEFVTPFGPAIYHQQLATANLAIPGTNHSVRMMQVLPLFVANYQIWRVTVRLPGTQYTAPDYTGFFPPHSIPDIYNATPPIADPPWWASSDWTLYSTGTSTPLVPITIPVLPGNSSPKVLAQIPPAGCLADGVTPSSVDSDWLGWGVMTYLVWV